MSKSNLLKLLFAFLLFGSLFFLGQKGRSEAVLHASLDELRSLRSQLFTVLDSDSAATSPFLSAARPATNQLSATPAFQNLLAVLRAEIKRIEPSAAQRLEKPASLEFRLASASLALAERRYSEALSSLTESDEQFAGEWAEKDRTLLRDVLRTRADAMLGLQQWSDAASRYQRLVDLDSANIEAKVRLADCYWASGNPAPALTLFLDAAEMHRKRGDTLTIQEKLEPALEHYQASSAILARLHSRNEKTNSSSSLPDGKSPPPGEHSVA